VFVLVVTVAIMAHRKLKSMFTMVGGPKLCPIDKDVAYR
jgi:hypothetical protein